MAESTSPAATKTTVPKKPDTASKAKPKKKQKRSVSSGHVHIQATFNNTMITVTDPKGNVLTWSSAGATGFRGSKKGTAYAAQIASEKALNQAKQQHGLKTVDVFVGGIGLGREAAIRALQNVEVAVDSIKDVTSTPHGGVRPKKPRRG